jgi:hypothetical protein
MSDVPINRVLKIGSEEPTAFLQYRLALLAILTDYVQARKIVGKSEAKQIYEDRLPPGLIRLRREVEIHSRSVRKKSTAAAAVAMVIVALGLTTRLSPGELAAMGSGALVGGMANLLGDFSSEPAEVKNHQVYFLLKLAQASSE